MARYGDVRWSQRRSVLGREVQVGAGPADWRGHRWYYSVEGNEPQNDEPAGSAADAFRWARDFIEECLS